MKRLPAVVLFLGLAAVTPAAFAQEHEAQKEEGAKSEHSEGEGGALQLWKWANFVVLAAGIGYLAGKNAGPMFAARTRQIRKEIIEADEARQEAEARAAAVEARLANLEAEIAALRAEAKQEADAETARLSRHSAAEIAKIEQHAREEIAGAAKSARLDLKRYSAKLAIELAERKIRDRMTPEAQDALVRGFVRDLQ
jgi:F-type H+-transporting ATPase subunit b